MTSEVKGLLLSFALIINSFRRKDIQTSIDVFDEKNAALNFIWVNAWSIPTEILGIGSKVQKNIYCWEGLDRAAKIFESGVLKAICNEKWEVKTLYELVLKIVLFYEKSNIPEEEPKSLFKQRNKSTLNLLPS